VELAFNIQVHPPPPTSVGIDASRVGLGIFNYLSSVQQRRMRSQRRRCVVSEPNELLSERVLLRNKNSKTSQSDTKPAVPLVRPVPGHTYVTLEAETLL